MARAIQFTKMHGTGNNYIYVNTLRFPIARPEKAAIEWSAYHTGIGSDGLVLIGHSDKADFSMRIFNADGSEAMMCGNASRCIGKYLYEYGLTSKNVITLDTLSGIKILELHLEGRTVETVTVDMGIPLKPVRLTSMANFRSFLPKCQWATRISSLLWTTSGSSIFRRWDRSWKNILCSPTVQM